MMCSQSLQKARTSVRYQCLGKELHARGRRVGEPWNGSITVGYLSPAGQVSMNSEMKVNSEP